MKAWHVQRTVSHSNNRNQNEKASLKTSKITKNLVFGCLPLGSRGRTQFLTIEAMILST